MVVAPNPDSRRASPEPIAPAPTMPTRSVRSSVRPVLQVVDQDRSNLLAQRQNQGCPCLGLGHLDAADHLLDSGLAFGQSLQGGKDLGVAAEKWSGQPDSHSSHSG